MSFGDTWGFGADEKESHRILDAYAASGGNFIDTANKYHEGQSEEFVGSYLGLERDRWVVASKYTLAMRPGDPNAAGNSRKNLRQSVEASLRRLRTDYLDLLWVHAWDYVTPIDEIVRALDDLVSAGKVAYVGLSDTPAWVAAQASTLASLRGWAPVVALQAEYSLIARTAEREILPMAEAFGLTMTAWGPIGAGVLSGKYTQGAATIAEASKRFASNSERLTDRNLAIAAEVDRIADKLGVTATQVALAWVRQRADCIIPVVGVRTVDQLGDIVAAADVQLGPESVAALADASRIDLGFPYDLLCGPQGQMVYGDLEPLLDLPPNAPYRWASRSPSGAS